jgi:hypothetical protein
MTTPDLSKFAAIATPLDKPKTPQMNGGVPAGKIHVTGAKRAVPGVAELPIVVVQVNSPAGAFVFHMELKNAADFGAAVSKAVVDMAP